jgi:hypothetical protein
MERIFCPRCRLHQSVDHRFCVRCGAGLPRELVQGIDSEAAKTFRFFAGVKVDERDHEGAFLRVSSYRRDQTFVTDEGSVTLPGHHVRFSVWVDNAAVCVISLPEAEARDLAEFLIGELCNLATPIR